MGVDVRRAIVSVLAGALVLGLGLGSPMAASAKSKDPRLTRSVYVDPSSAAASAAKKDKRFAAISTRGQAFWVTDRYTTKTVRSAVSRYATRASKARRTPLLAVYAIPSRDCGNHSAGGLTPTQYKAWVREVAAGLKGKRAMVVLEPDALAQLGDCAGQGDRAGLLAYATRTLTASGTWVYIDAGHSSWRSPATMAERLVAAGVTKARGFATNVGNFRSSPQEIAYAQAVRRELVARGVRNRTFVVDTSRNGATVAAGEFCNPLAARLGRAPKIVDQAGHDAYVWVKRPGESDGACQGGPASGTWWGTGALRLLRS